MDSNYLQDLAKQLYDALPDEAHQLKSDLQNNFHTVLQGAFNRMELVTREDYDTQVKVLARTREKVEALEARVAELEAQLEGKPPQQT